MQTQFLYRSKGVLFFTTVLLLGISFFGFLNNVHAADLRSEISSQSSFHTSSEGSSYSASDKKQPCFEAHSSVEGTNSSKGGGGSYQSSHVSEPQAKSNGRNESEDTCLSRGATNSSLDARLAGALKKIAELQDRIAHGGVGVKTGDVSPRVRPCFVFNHTMHFGIKDADTNGEVSALQTFLAKDSTLYPEGDVTGYYGKSTEKAVQRYQSQNDIVKGGTSQSSGFGSFGEQTRTAFAQRCHKDTASSTSSYGLTDVKTITYKSSSVMDAGGIYTVTLNDGTMRTVHGAGFMQNAKAFTEKQFRASGYTGDVSALLALITKSVVVGTCKSGTETYPEGTKRNSIVLEDGSISSIADATFVCTNGAWKVSGGTFGPKNAPYTLDDVKTITYKSSMVLDTGKLYTVTLNDGTTRTVRGAGFIQNPVVVTEKLFRASGYTGDVSALLAKAVKEVITTCKEKSLTASEVRTLSNTKECNKQYVLTDIKTVTASVVNPKVSDASTQYTITLTDGTVRTVLVAGNMLASMQEDRFRASGYTGDISALKALVTKGSVLGAETSSADVLLDEILNRIDAVVLDLEALDAASSEDNVAQGAVLGASTSNTAYAQSNYVTVPQTSPTTGYSQGSYYTQGVYRQGSTTSSYVQSGYAPRYTQGSYSVGTRGYSQSSYTPTSHYTQSSYATGYSQGSYQTSYTQSNYSRTPRDPINHYSSSTHNYPTSHYTQSSYYRPPYNHGQSSSTSQYQGGSSGTGYSQSAYTTASVAELEQRIKELMELIAQLKASSYTGPR